MPNESSSSSPSSNSDPHSPQLDLVRWRRSLILRELHQQWMVNRGSAVTGANPAIPSFQRPFSRDWERLLEDAQVLSAEDRKEAERDVRALADLGLLQLRFVTHRPHLIERVIVPLSSQDRLRDIFPTPLKPVEPEAASLPAIWEPELQFLTQWRVGVPGEDLLRINQFLASGGRNRPIVPIKERSLELFDDEKRLDVLAGSALFRPGRLSLQQLRCEVVGEPFGWKPGASDTGRVIVVENAATWHSFARWNRERSLFTAVIYGCGNKTADHIALLDELIISLGGSQRVFYFGDLDPQGVRIPNEANLRARSLGLKLAPIEPHVWSYEHLLNRGRAQEMELDQPWSWSSTDLGWFGELGDRVRNLFEARRRIAQEHVGWEFLSAEPQNPSCNGIS